MSTDRHTVSACLIVLDEAEVLPAALASVAFCDEVVVVDSGSTDGTQALARAAGARVVEHPWPGFGAQRNVAADHATGEWILEVDADETITPELAAEIIAFLSTPGARDEVDILALPMRHRLLGGFLERSAAYPNYRTRMFRRGAYRHDESRTVHEGLKPTSTTLALRADMTHELAATWREALGDTWRYARFEAGQFHPRVTPRTVAVGLVVRPLAKAGYRLVVDGAWRDGWRGVVKVALDTGSDALVWARVLTRADRTPRGDEHFGEEMPRAGVPRVVALATSVEGARRADAWLREAIALGAGRDSELVTAVPVAHRDAPYHVRDGGTGGPLALARALVGSVQVRKVDALLYADRRARRGRRLLEGRVPTSVGPVDPGDPPATVLRAVAELTG